MDEIPVKQENNRSEDGTFKKGVSGNPSGRPKEKTIKERVREYLDEHPNDMESFVKHFVEKNRELSWQMLEGSPKATTETNIKSVHIELTGEDLRLAQELEERRRLDNPHE